MIYLAFSIFMFALIQLIVAIVNSVFIQRPKVGSGHFHGLVSILIPARNEERNISNLLLDLQKQDYEHLEIIVFNDLSADRTEEIVTKISKTDKRIRLVNSQGLPFGWLGKNHACHCLSSIAKGEYLLFLDADVRIKDGLIANSIALAERHKIGLLSIFPKQKMESLGEYLSVPVMNYILLTLLPLVLVFKSKFSSIAAANGQFMLFKRVPYFETLPHEKFKNCKVEDIEIARYFKQMKYPVFCRLGDDAIECRMYHGLNEAVNGFSKNVVNFFGNSFFAAILFWFVTTFGCLVIFSECSTVFLCLFLFIVLATRVIVSIISKQNVLLNVLLLVAQQFILGFIIFKALLSNKQLKWKGRSI